MPEDIVLTPMSNAADSLNRAAAALEHSHPAGLFALKGALAWSWHAAWLLAHVRLQDGRRALDPWLQDYLREGDPSLNVERDAHWQEREHLSHLELLDLLSAPELPILRPEFFQGWQDRTSRCRSLRHQISALLGMSIDAGTRDRLVLLLAVYHRLNRLPASLTIALEPVRAAFPALIELCETLLDRQSPDSEIVAAAAERCRAALSD